nr:capsule assembly Wzi family protein [uncultured Carboxylicivirga sp.]
MIQVRKVALVFLLFFSFCLLNAQEKFDLKIESSVSIANEGIVPTWLYANEWGIYSSEIESYGMFYLKGDCRLLDKKSFSLKVGSGIVVNTDLNQSILHEVFFKGQVWLFDYTIGKEANSWVSYNDRLTSGSFLMSENARPLPKITLGFDDYKQLSFLPDWFEVRGGISQGILNDKRGDKINSANNLLVHEKWAYGRFAIKNIKPYLGIVHSALFGGTRPDGTKIPVDFWPTFFARGSSKLGGGEETNAAGAHMGMWDFGFYLEKEKFDLQFYFQKPFADGSGLNFWFGKNKDHIIGLLIHPKEINWLKGVSLELIKTAVQSGYGIPDQLYPVDYNEHKAGSIIWRADVEDNLDDFMFQVFGEERTGWTWTEALRIIENKTNEGNKFGGRDDYMNNGSYYNGWTYHGSSMGTPLYHTTEMVQRI